VIRFDSPAPVVPQGHRRGINRAGQVGQQQLPRRHLAAVVADLADDPSPRQGRTGEVVVLGLAGLGVHAGRGRGPMPHDRRFRDERHARLAPEKHRAGPGELMAALERIRHPLQPPFLSVVQHQAVVGGAHHEPTPRRLHGGERAGQRRRGMKLRGQMLRRGQMRHDELTIPFLRGSGQAPQPRLHLGRFRNIPTVIVQWLDKK